MMSVESLSRVIVIVHELKVSDAFRPIRFSRVHTHLGAPCCMIGRNPPVYSTRVIRDPRESATHINAQRLPSMWHASAALFV